MRVPQLLATCALLLPASPALAGPADLVVAVPSGVVLAGVTWSSGSPVVQLRQRGIAGWSPWETLETDGLGRPGTEPVWLGRGVARLAVRVGGARGVRVELVRDPGPASSSAPASATLPRLGSVVTRAGWGADERWRSGKVAYARGVQAVVLHHTATPNDYTAAEAAGYVRSVYAYHTRSRRWEDIGYNLLVDRFGTVYEGRYGGILSGRAVEGAHTAGFNSGTLGVALLGNFDLVDVPAPARDRVAGAVAWASERWRFDPRSTVTLTSDGGGAHRRGARVSVNRLAGHRDLGATACPGRHAYAALPALRETAWHKLAAVISEVTLTGVPVRPPRPVTIGARLDHAASWTVVVTGRFGTMARATGRGTVIGLTWDGTTTLGLPAPPGEYAYEVTADDGVHGPSDPVTGTFTVALPA